MPNFTRLKTESESREMYFVEMKAIMIEISTFMNSSVSILKKYKIPEYLKRIKKDSFYAYILIGEDNDKFSNDDLYNFSNDDLYKVSNDNIPNHSISNKIITVKVPAFMPETEEQIKACENIWPVRYLKRTETKIDQKLANKMIEKLNFINFYEGTNCCGAVIIADGNNIKYFGGDQKSILEHSIFVGVEEVSKFLNKNATEKIHQNLSENENNLSSQNINYSYQNINYLCTGFSAYMLKEPCLACAMALVHGRINKVFVKNRSKNGIFSEKRFNYNKNLNHRYLVYFEEI